jgi:hypothetical protein
LFIFIVLLIYVAIGVVIAGYATGLMIGGM